MFYRALKSVLLLSLTLSISSMAAESPVSSSSALSTNAVLPQSAATLDKQPQSSATLETPSQSIPSSSSASAPAKPLSKWQTLPEVNAPWMKGERLEYELSWGFITAGYATLEVKPRKDGKTEFLTFATANKTVNKFYPVHDTVYTLVRNKGLMTDVFRKSLHEGTFHNKSLISFNHDGKTPVLSATILQDPVNHSINR